MAKQQSKPKWVDEKHDYSSTLQWQDIRLVVHHWVGMGDTWFASCADLFDRVKLESKTLEAAKKEALLEFEAAVDDWVMVRDLFRKAK